MSENPSSGASGASGASGPDDAGGASGAGGARGAGDAAGLSGARDAPGTSDASPSAEAIDPDVDLHLPEQRAETARGHRLPVLLAISAGGVAGALARHAVNRQWPAAEGTFPWATFWINVLGSALIGVLMVLVSEGGRRAHPLMRPFVGVGVLGGFTTFSTYALDLKDLLERDEAGLALAYAGGTVAGCLGAVWLASVSTRAVAARAAASGAAPK
ncbi:fluoride efflux transporter FluC [Streptomyces sp. NPDC056437]|uniref:fluoride efflux transporter FluC n=1 Tax=Streptomyces sp. NPDC056437 TaxID=3345816 RepID=UPI00368765F2